MEGYEMVLHSRQIGLVYSPDDNGYYWQELFGEWLCSKIFATRAEAMSADEEDMEWN